MSKKSNPFFLDFEKPLQELHNKIIEIEKEISDDNSAYSKTLESLKIEFQNLKEQVYANLDPKQKLQIARHPDRPYVQDYARKIGSDWIELHGDRLANDDQAIVGGLLQLTDNLTVMLIGNEKGRGIKEKQLKNFGMPQPSGYRKALRLFKHAERFKMPIVTLVDTPGAYPGLEAEAHGQASAIAVNIQEMFNISVPVITIITGEGGSGGALALAVANKVFMLEHSVYSVISPEGCAAILWRTAEKSAEAAKSLKITSNELLELGLIDEIIKEPLGGAHQDPELMFQRIKEKLVQEIKDLQQQTTKQLVQTRREKFQKFGFFSEENLTPEKEMTSVKF